MKNFLRAILDRKLLVNEKMLKLAFRFFDTEKFGVVINDRIMKYFIGTNMTEEVFNNIFDEIDTDKNGIIDFNDFKEMMMY